MAWQVFLLEFYRVYHFLKDRRTFLNSLQTFSTVETYRQVILLLLTGPPISYRYHRHILRTNNHRNKNVLIICINVNKIRNCFSQAMTRNWHVWLPSSNQWSIRVRRMQFPSFRISNRNKYSISPGVAILRESFFATIYANQVFRKGTRGCIYRSIFNCYSTILNKINKNTRSKLKFRDSVFKNRYS